MHQLLIAHKLCGGTSNYPDLIYPAPTINQTKAFYCMVHDQTSQQTIAHQPSKNNEHYSHFV